MNLKLVNKLGAGEQAFGPGASGERDLRRRKEAPDFTQRRYCHDCIADPVGPANHDPLDVFRVEFSHWLQTEEFSISHLTFLIGHLGDCSGCRSAMKNEKREMLNGKPALTVSGGQVRGLNGRQDGCAPSLILQQ